MNKYSLYSLIIALDTLFRKGSLDKRICDCEEKATNKETYREFIINGYRYLNGENVPLHFSANLDKMTNMELNEIVDELDWLLEK